MDKYNTISFCRAHYKDLDGEVNEHRLFTDVADFIRLAVANGYQMKIFDDGYTLIVDYNYQDEGLSGVSLEWLGENEYIENYAEGETE